MFVPVWVDQVKENFGLQEAETPVIQWRRMLLEGPTLKDLQTAYEKLVEGGVPLDAKIEFLQWNSPKENFYIHASWQE